MQTTRLEDFFSGFKHGCKCAAVAPGGTVLHTEIIKIPFSAPLQAEQPAVLALKKIILDFKCVDVDLEESFWLLSSGATRLNPLSVFIALFSGVTRLLWATALRAVKPSNFYRT